MSHLADKTCVPCQGGVPPLEPERIAALLAEIDGWGLNDAGHLERTYTFPDFVQALEFTNRVGAVAEDQGHHPDIHLAWGKAVIEIWTHKIDGLTESDFIFAAKIDRL